MDVDSMALQRAADWWIIATVVCTGAFLAAMVWVVWPYLRRKDRA